MLCLKSMRGHDPTPDLLKRLNLFMNWLDTITTKPKLSDQTHRQLLDTLKLMFDPNEVRKQTHFTPDIKTRAQALHERWATPETLQVIEDDDSEGAEAPEGTTHGQPDATAVPVSASFRLPPRTHPIFGDRGPMRGVAYTIKRRKGYILNPVYKHLKKSPSSFGHNGLQVGDWWPLQVAALFNGAHGSFKGGISGHVQQGAHSIVTSGFYEELDQDNGEVLYYSGSGSHDHTDPERPKDTQATGLLHKSLANGHPVRVLRSSSSGGGSWCPSVGIRYDGLYRVVDVRTPLNRQGGMYYQFELRRLSGQPELSELRAIPTQEQRLQYEAVKLGY